MRIRSLCGGVAALLVLLGVHAGADDTHVSVLTAQEVIQILDETVEWYRTLGAQQQNASQPSDLLILFANRQTADKVVGLAFEIARANAELLSSEANPGTGATTTGTGTGTGTATTNANANANTNTNTTPTAAANTTGTGTATANTTPTPTTADADASAPQALHRKQIQLDAERQSLEDEIKSRQQLSVGGKARAQIQAKLPELQGELAMIDARKNLLDTMAEFVDESDPKGAGASALKAQIDAIAATVPSAGTSPAATVTGAAAAPAVSSAQASTAANEGSAAPHRSGIWELATAVMKLRTKITTIELIDRRTAALAQTFQRIGAAPQTQLQAYLAQSDALALQADKAAGAALKPLRAEFDTLAWLFKQTSAILIPLTKEQVLLQQYRHNLANWHDAAQRQFHEALTALGVRLGILVGFLAVLFVLGEIWRRTVLRYVHDARRRYQLLLVRRIVLWAAVVVLVGLSFVTEISALATFAGLLTAGLAVAMQSVLVSVVGYFFLIGKHGIRVGDRIQIGTVAGEVIDIGLVRMHLMELNQTGPLGPTGRVVAFANLIVFQASGGLFKQIPGVNLSWHETTLSLPPVADYGALKQALLAAIAGVLGDYREEIERQAREIERSTDTNSVTDPVPHVQMHLANGHMEALIRYPVHLEHAAEMDERVSVQILKVIAASGAEADHR